MSHEAGKTEGSAPFGQSLGDRERLERLISAIKEYNPLSDSGRICAAYDFACSAHMGQQRDSGEAYITHPLAVAEILAEMQLDDTSIVTGFLHDVLEDTQITSEEMEQKFGADALLLVQGVTKLSKLSYRSKQERQAENLRKMFFAMAEDIRIILIKLADRLHNMRTIHSHHSKLRQVEIAEETLHIFAPLAHRLGMFRMKDELEERCMEILEPEKYQDLVQRLAARKPEDDKNLELVCSVIKSLLAEAGIKAEVKGRFKSYYSIHKKMVRQQKELSEIFDLNAIRIIVSTVNECYAVLGVIHTMWKPIPGRFKDYVAMPKQNMYQSIHTTVLVNKGEPMEVQIRTVEMDNTAEYGIAAHWKYKEGKSGDAQFDKKVEWLRQMLDWQNEMRDADEFMNSVRLDLSSESVYVFSPKGDVYELQAGSCPIDFAYRVHTEVGHQCIGAKVNRRIVPIDYSLRNGDIVEILTAKGSGPSRDWLKIAKTTQAQNKIRQWFRKEKRDENILLGREAMEKELHKYGYEPATIMRSDKLMDAARRFNFHCLEDMYAAIGDGALQPLPVLLKTAGFKREKESVEPKLTPSKAHTTSHGVWVRGAENIALRMANCCKPLPGDEIIGYITKGRGVSVHRQDCPNVGYYRSTEPDRLLEVGWSGNIDGLYQVGIEAIGKNRDRLTIDIMAAIADTKTAINAATAVLDKKTDTVTVNIKLEVHSMEQLDYIINRVRKVKNIMEAWRSVTQNNRKKD